MILHKILFVLLVSEHFSTTSEIVSHIFLSPQLISGLKAEKLEWGNPEQLEYILQSNPEGFDLVLGADIYILISAFHLYRAYLPCFGNFYSFFRVNKSDSHEKVYLFSYRLQFCSIAF